MRHHSFGASMRMIARQAARAQRARQRAQASERAAAVRALRNAERQAKADAKEAARLRCSVRAGSCLACAREGATQREVRFSCQVVSIRRWKQRHPAV
jgi:hypothetical protein